MHMDGEEWSSCVPSIWGPWMWLWYDFLNYFYTTFPIYIVRTSPFLNEGEEILINSRGVGGDSENLKKEERG